MSDQINPDNKSISPQKTNDKIIKKIGVWPIIGIIAIVLIAVGGTGGGYALHLSNTDPEFCASCHPMENNVRTYLSSNYLANIHYQAGVTCKDCHSYPVSAEVTSGINYFLGNYSVLPNGDLAPVKFSNEMCLKCHISYAHLAVLTDYLAANPHQSHYGDLPCSTCHVSHGPQIDYCGECHQNTEQRMLDEPIKPRGTIP